MSRKTMVGSTDNLRPAVALPALDRLVPHTVLIAKMEELVAGWRAQLDAEISKHYVHHAATRNDFSATVTVHGEISRAEYQVKRRAKNQMKPEHLGLLSRAGLAFTAGEPVATINSAYCANPEVVAVLKKLPLELRKQLPSDFFKVTQSIELPADTALTVLRLPEPLRSEVMPVALTYALSRVELTDPKALHRAARGLPALLKAASEAAAAAMAADTLAAVAAEVGAKPAAATDAPAPTVREKPARRPSSRAKLAAMAA